MKYGLITDLDCRVLDKTLELVCLKFPDDVINTLELGVRDGSGSRGIRNFFLDKNREINHTGIDNQNDMIVHPPFEGCNIIIGSSIEAYIKVEDDSQHFVFIDANHSYIYTMADFLLYSDKVVAGGYLAFHDTGAHIKPFTDYQRVGDNLHHDNYISCRKALKKLGLLDNKFEGWQLIFDEADETKFTGGVTVIERIK